MATGPLAHSSGPLNHTTLFSPDRVLNSIAASTRNNNLNPNPNLLSLAMATIGAAATTSTLITRAAVPKRPATVSSPIIAGVPLIGARGGRVRCSAEAKPSAAAAGTSLLAAASVLAAASPVLALVDERMSTEGTGLSLGISNNLLVWILLGVFGIIWALFFTYTSTLEEDDDSALSL